MEEIKITKAWIKGLLRTVDEVEQDFDCLSSKEQIKIIAVKRLFGYCYSLEDKLIKKNMNKGYSMNVSEWKNYGEKYQFFQFFENKIKEEEEEKAKQMVEEIIKLSDRIESKYETPEMEEWKAFKHFRNSLRDTYLNALK